MILYKDSDRRELQLLNEIYQLNVQGIVFSLNQTVNVSVNLQIAIYLKDWSSLPCFFSMMLKSMRFPLTVSNRTSNGGIDFLFLQSPEFYSCIQFVIRKIGLLILLSCKADSLTVFTAMYPKEQQTSDNLIVEGNCFVIEIFDKLIKDL